MHTYVELNIKIVNKIMVSLCKLGEDIYVATESATASYACEGIKLDVRW